MSDKLTKIIQLLMMEEEDNDDLLILLALLLDRKKERTKEDLPPSDDVSNKKRYPQLFTRLFCKHCSMEVQHTKVEDQTKVLIARVYHYFECEYEELKQLYGDRDLTPLSKFRQRTALATGVSETTVLQILKEEESRNAEKREDLARSRALKRTRQTKSSSLEDSSDDSVSDSGQPSNVQEAQDGAEVETLVVKLEPECDNEQVQINTDSVQVKVEPPDADVNKEEEPKELKRKRNRERQRAFYHRQKELKKNETKIKKKKERLPKSNAERQRKFRQRHAEKSYVNMQQTQGESSTAAASSSVRLTEELDEQQTQGESSTAAASTAAASSSVRLTEELDESDLSEETEVKVEKIEIGEEGFS